MNLSLLCFTTICLLCLICSEQALSGERNSSTLNVDELSTLVEALRDERTSVRHRAASELGRFGRDAISAAPALTEALKDRYSHVRAAAAIALTKVSGLNDLSQVGPFWADYSKIDPTSRAGVPTLIVAVPTLIDALRGGSPESRCRVAMALGQIGPPAKEAVPALIEALRDKDEDVRIWAAFALGGIGAEDKVAATALSDALADEKWSVSAAAASALGRVGPATKDVVPALMETLNRKDSVACAYAAMALGHIGPSAKAAVPDLIDALKNKGAEPQFFLLFLTPKTCGSIRSGRNRPGKP